NFVGAGGTSGQRKPQPCPIPGGAVVEAKQNSQVRRGMTRWMKYDLIALDEVGYVPLAHGGAEFLFRGIFDRAERAALIVTTNLPFSEWTTVFPNPRLCKALLGKQCLNCLSQLRGPPQPGTCPHHCLGLTSAFTTAIVANAVCASDSTESYTL